MAPDAGSHDGQRQLDPGRVECPNCGAPLDVGPSECPFCHTALVEERRSTAHTAPGTTVTTLLRSNAFIATPEGVEAVVRRCPGCGATVNDPRAASCPHCQTTLPSLAESAVVRGGTEAHLGLPTSPEGRARLEQSLDRAAVSPELRQALLRAGPQLQAGCPECGSPLALHAAKRGQPAGVKLRIGFGKRGRDRSAEAIRPSVPAGPSEFEVRCTRCAFRAPLANS